MVVVTPQHLRIIQRPMETLQVLMESYRATMLVPVVVVDADVGGVWVRWQDKATQWFPSTPTPPSRRALTTPSYP